MFSKPKQYLASARKFIIFLLVALIAFNFNISSLLAAGFLADSGDRFNFYGPGPNSIVSGTVSTTWQVSDDEQANVPYEINLFDANLCNTKIASITSGNIASSGNTITSNWNSAGAFPETAKLNDGRYCLQICVSLRNGTTPYSACSARIITIRNTNRAPSFISANPGVVQIGTTGAWTFDFNSIDPDGDPINYKLTNTPNFLSINAANGIISTNNNPRTPGSYSVTVQVRDSLGAANQLTFTVIIVASAPTPPPPPTTPSTTTTPTPTTPTPQPQPELSIEILSPKQNETWRGDENEIMWEIKNGEGKVKEIVVSHSTDNTNWTEISKLEADKTTYRWDVSQLPDGNYYVEVLVKTEDNKEFRTTSPVLNIKNSQDPDDLLTKPLIVDVSPSDKAELRDRKPTISGKFTPPIGGTILADSFKLFIDDKDWTEICEVDAAGFVCKLNSDLDLGAHKVKAEVKDDKEQEAEKIWTFSLIDEAGLPGNSSSSQGAEGILIGDRFIPRQTLAWGLLICCTLFLLLIIPWLLFSLWRRRNYTRVEKKTTKVETTKVTPETDTNYTFAPLVAAPPAAEPVMPEVNVNYYYPEVAETPITEPQDLTAFSSEPLVAAEPEPLTTTTTETTQTTGTDVFTDPTTGFVRDESTTQNTFVNDPLPAVSDPFVEPVPTTSTTETTTNTTNTTNIYAVPEVLATPEPIEPEVINSTTETTETVTQADGSTSTTTTSTTTPSETKVPDWLSPIDSTSTTETTTTTKSTSNTSNPEDSKLGAYGYGSKIDE